MGIMRLKQCHVYHPWLGMVNISTHKHADFGDGLWHWVAHIKCLPFNVGWSIQCGGFERGATSEILMILEHTRNRNSKTWMKGTSARKNTIFNGKKRNKLWIYIDFPWFSHGFSTKKNLNDVPCRRNARTRCTRCLVPSTRHGMDIMYKVVYP